MKTHKRYACHRVYDGCNHYHPQSVVTVTEKGEVLECASLTHETPFTEWIGGVIILSPMIELSMARDFKTLLNNAFREKNDSHLYAWHVSHFDFTKEDINPQSILRKLH